MIDVIYKDENYIVCIKPAGILSTDEANGMPILLRNQLGLNDNPHTVHRLDRVVSGLMIFAVDSVSAAEISKQIKSGLFHKKYLAVVHGKFEDKQGIMNDLLFRDSSKNMTYVVKRMRKGVREATLEYKVLDEYNDYSLVLIRLITGRTHQIRAQFSSRGHFLLGDKKYGAQNDNCQVALWSSEIGFINPNTKKEVVYRQLPPNIYPWNLFSDNFDLTSHFDYVQQKKCDHSNACNGCKYISLTYQEQLAIKQNMLEKFLSNFCDVNPIIGMDYPYNYRNKVTRSFSINKGRKAVYGIYKQDSHSIVEIKDCLLEDLTASKIIDEIYKMLPSFKIEAYDENKCTGFLRHVQVRRSETTNEIMVILVVTHNIFKLQKQFITELISKFPEITTIVLNYNNSHTSVVLGNDFKVIYGKGYIEDKLNGFTFRLSPGAFYQVNNKLTKELYSTAIEYADLCGDETVLDAYCGTGTIGLCASKKAKYVIGVEKNANAVKDAVVNSKINDIVNYQCVCNDTTKFIRELDSNYTIDLAFLDPPRAGCSQEFLNILKSHKPKKIVYISCNPVSLSRDLKFLSKYYTTNKIQGFDMFPFTEHVETVVLMSRK